MENNYFVYKGKKYIIKYNDKDINIYVFNNNIIQEASHEEKQEIKEILNSECNYVYDSTILNDLVSANPQIEYKEYVMNFLNWLEGIIPEDCRYNFYKNVETLQTALNITSSKVDDHSIEHETVAGYNTKKNNITINKESLQELWEIAKLTSNPKDFYFRQYSQTLLHELSHMASSNYDSETKTSLCGFDKFPPDNESEKNRGLTEGYTEILSMAGVPGTIELSSGYYIEASLINQLILLVGNETFARSYFLNLGITPIQNKLNEIINNPIMSYNLFRSIELNYSIKNLNEEQNVLGNIQLMLLDYLDKKLEQLLSDNKISEISNILINYDWLLIKSDKLKTMKKNPQKFIGIEESLKKFGIIKEKYQIYLNESIKSTSIKT